LRFSASYCSLILRFYSSASFTGVEGYRKEEMPHEVGVGEFDLESSWGVLTTSLKNWFCF
jgi:hypothetical protein